MSENIKIFEQVVPASPGAATMTNNVMIHCFGGDDLNEVIDNDCDGGDLNEVIVFFVKYHNHNTNIGGHSPDIMIG